MNIVVVGTGYVGLVSGTCFAQVGHTVTCLDIDQEKVDKLKLGKVTIFEPRLQELACKNLEEKRLFFTSDFNQAISDAKVTFFCVPTPSTETGSADLSFLKAALSSFAKAMNRYQLVVIKSTVPPGTAKIAREYLKSELEKLGKSHEFDVISNPEFLREGCAVNDCLNPDRVIIGCEKESLIPKVKDLYSPFNLTESQLLFMDCHSAEMAKYAANAMLASRISFMNELSGLCEKVGANIESVREGIGSDVRIGTQFLYAGAGFGGSCFPKDIRALRSLARELNCETPILDAVEKINESQKKLLAKKIQSYFSNQGGVKGKTIAVWGVSFKPNTDDIREAPALELIKQLQSMGAHLRLYDPVALKNVEEKLGSSGYTFCEDEYEASKGADAVALITEWNQFKKTNLDDILNKMRGNALFDGRNQYVSCNLNKRGFNYFAIGVPKT